MASLAEKIINGRKYYYARVCKRVNGKPKIVQTHYLGTVEKMIENAHGPKQIPRAKEVVKWKIKARIRINALPKVMTSICICKEYSHV